MILKDMMMKNKALNRSYLLIRNVISRHNESVLHFNRRSLTTQLFTRVSETPCPALQHPKEEQEEGLQIRPGSRWSHSALPAAFLTSPHQWTQTTVSWRYFICNLITMLIALNVIMMGNRCLEFEGSIAAVQQCSHSVMANSLCGGRGRICFRLGSKYHLLFDICYMEEHPKAQIIRKLHAHYDFVHKISLKNMSVLMVSASSRVSGKLVYRLKLATLLKAESSTKGVWYDTASPVYGTEAVNGS